MHLLPKPEDLALVIQTGLICCCILLQTDLSVVCATCCKLSEKFGDGENNLFELFGPIWKVCLLPHSGDLGCGEL